MAGSDRNITSAAGYRFPALSERIVLTLGLLVLFVIAHYVLNELADLRPKRYLPSFLVEEIPFIPVFIFIYLLGYISAIVPAFVIHDRREFRRTAFRFLILMLICFAFFLGFPFAVHRVEDPVGQGLSVKALEWFQSRVKPYNSLPSLHVGASVLAAACCMSYARRVGWVMAIFAVLVALSTLFLKVHNILDAVAGVVIVLAVWLITGDRANKPDAAGEESFPR